MKAKDMKHTLMKAKDMKHKEIIQLLEDADVYGTP